ncbi:MAG TPA: cob(I)yrinic acid a,c-diamide adenosyltransferase [Chitinophagaceae bacterium]|jgi:cob(I)alamin adenosyltransferase|nr:cob(I)yrinic acid a,c-diamide adenosyltransferase [Chitinophagaceae bacterium]
MAFKIYTKTGDLGKTSLIGGTKVLKNHIRIETYGTIDELNSFTGLAADHLTDSHSQEVLREIQDRLFTIGSSLACDPDKELKLKIPDLKESDIMLLEDEIDAMENKLPPMKSFVIPGGHPAVSTLHVVRCVCRRAERLAVSMQTQDLAVAPLIIIYLNRLSDYLFVLARYTAFILQVAEIPWKPRV